LSFTTTPPQVKRNPSLQSSDSMKDSILICLSLFVFCSIVAICNASISAPSSSKFVATVHFASNGSVVVVDDVLDHSGAAWGTYDESMDAEGFGKLYINTGSQFSDNQQAFAAGYLEGYLTHVRIVQHYNNLLQVFFKNGSFPQNVNTWLTEQREWFHSQIEANKDDGYWKVAATVYEQKAGLVEGFNSQVDPSQHLTGETIEVVAAFGDFLTLTEILGSSKDSPHHHTLRQMLEEGHCTGFVRATPDLGELYIAHTSWFTYSAMNRIMKHYEFAFANPAVVSHKVSFSSYPATLASNDDFYVTEQQLAIFETTNGIYNKDLFKLVVPQSLLCWTRAMIANYMSKTGADWAKYFAMHNSGTYNNQYAIVDYKLFTPYQPLVPGLLTVLEQIPGYVESADLTDILTFGYFGSYNVPYFHKIYVESGFAEVEKQVGTGVTHQLAPRAKIMRRDATPVQTLEDMQHFMQYNDFTVDPLANGDPAAAISSRFDLEASKPSCNGGYDSKITSSSLIKDLRISCKNGPTQQQPRWIWTDYWKSQCPHAGLPEIYEFSFIDFYPIKQ